MKILLSGSSGLIGQGLMVELARVGHDVLRLVRRADFQENSAASGEVRWNPEQDRIDRAALRTVQPEVVIHLAGEGIARRRWTPGQKTRIRESRVRGTALLASSLAELDHPPSIFLCASAVGIYGDRGEEILDETSPPGTGFLAEVCRAWEQAAATARPRTTRLVHLRFGAVLSAEGGMIKQMLPVFRLGLGGPMGTGRQWLSWITLCDAIRAMTHILGDSTVAGPVNMVTPHPVTQREFTRSLGRTLRRPVKLIVPAFVLRLVLGEMADGLLLSSQRARPDVLTRSGFQFQDPHIDQALASLWPKTLG